MGLENVTFVAQLVTTNPDGATDPKSEGDDHFRLIKRTLVNSFPNITATVLSTPAELNTLNGYLGNTNDLNILRGAVSAGVGNTEFLYLHGLTSTLQVQINTIKTGNADLSNVTDTVTARQNLGLGAIAVLDEIGSTALATTVGSWIEIDTASVANPDSTATLTGMNSTYNIYMIKAWNLVRAGSANNLLARVTWSGTPQTGSNYRVEGTGAQSSINLGAIDFTATDPSALTMYIYNPSSTTEYIPIISEYLQGTDCTKVSKAARYESTGAVDGIQFYPTSGPYTTGEFRLYGLKT